MPNPRVVVADDHAEMRARIVRLLEFEFDVVATVADGQAAVEACGALDPDVVVLDITMPVLNGFAVRHSSAARFSVNLKGTPNAISLTVRDTGRGFDPASVSQDGGLGLTSMRERLRLVAGELLIESQPALGTTIVARVPLPTGPASSPSSRETRSGDRH